MVGCGMVVRGVGVYVMSVGCMGAEFHEEWTMEKAEREMGLVGLKMSGVVGGGYGGRVGALWAVRVRCERGATTWWRCGLCGWPVRVLKLHMGCWVGYGCMVEVWGKCGCMWGMREGLEGCMIAMGWPWAAYGLCEWVERSVAT